MNTIYETTSNETQSVQKSTDNGTSVCTTTVTTATTNGQKSSSNVNGGSSVTSITSDTTSISSEEYCDNLKIINHLKSIEKINEKRRVFLTNTISEYSSDEKNESEIKNSLNGHNGSSSSNGKVIDAIKTTTPISVDNLNIEEKRFQRMRATAESFESSSDQEFTFASPPYTTPLKSPSSPPPKPPMLSRNRSIGNSSDRASLQTPPQSPVFQVPATAADMELPRSAVFQGPLLSSAQTEQSSEVSQIVAADAAQIDSTPTVQTVNVLTVSSTVDEPVIAATVELTETAVLRKVQRPQSLAPAVPREISERHYERMVEELKCPGCASPMKGPVLLCESGHSICSQCTRVLLMCPLCKEPFTTLRSLTVEALCSKAHFRCMHAEGGCTVRLHLDLLGWHEKNCIYKPMKCFMGRIWGDCKWAGREINWKEHVETEHANKVFTDPTTDLIWNMGIKQKRITAYYVFVVFDEMFNFYEVYDNDRVLFTMTCTSAVRDKKDNFAFEVTIIHQDNEAFSITQKFPVHSEYDKDILMEGTCVNIPITDLSKFIDYEKLLHYRVRVLEVKSPRKSKSRASNSTSYPLDFQNTQIEGGNLKNIPPTVILTRTAEEEQYISSGEPETPSMEDEFDIMRRQYEGKFKKTDRNPSETDSDPELEAFIRQKWGTPQLHFNRKFLGNNSSDTSSADDASNPSRNKNRLSTLDRKVKLNNDLDKASISSTASTSYKKRVTNTLRKSFRNIKSDIIDLKPFGKKSSPEKIPEVQEKRKSSPS